MRCLVFATALLGAAATAAPAQDAIPDLKGTWSGKGKSIVFGTHAHHPGSQTTADPPREGAGQVIFTRAAKFGSPRICIRAAAASVLVTQRLEAADQSHALC